MSKGFVVVPCCHSAAESRVMAASCKEYVLENCSSAFGGIITLVLSGLAVYDGHHINQIRFFSLNQTELLVYFLQCQVQSGSSSFSLPAM